MAPKPRLIFQAKREGRASKAGQMPRPFRPAPALKAVENLCWYYRFYGMSSTASFFYKGDPIENVFHHEIHHFFINENRFSRLKINTFRVGGLLSLNVLLVPLTITKDIAHFGLEKVACVCMIDDFTVVLLRVCYIFSASYQLTSIWYSSGRQALDKPKVRFWFAKWNGDIGNRYCQKLLWIIIL